MWNYYTIYTSYSRRRSIEHSLFLRCKTSLIYRASSQPASPILGYGSISRREKNTRREFALQQSQVRCQSARTPHTVLRSEFQSVNIFIYAHSYRLWVTQYAVLSALWPFGGKYLTLFCKSRHLVGNPSPAGCEIHFSPAVCAGVFIEFPRNRSINLCIFHDTFILYYNVLYI